MRGVAKVDFISMYIDPLRPQPAREIPAHAGGENLREREPDDRSKARSSSRTPPSSTMARRMKDLTPPRA